MPFPKTKSSFVRIEKFHATKHQERNHHPDTLFMATQSVAHRLPILSSKPPQKTIGLGSKISNSEPKLFLSSSISTIEGCLCRIALISLMGDELLELDAYECLSMVEREVDRERRNEVRMLEKEDEMDLKRVVCILTGLRVVDERIVG